jgi:hypothetical protein
MTTTQHQAPEVTSELRECPSGHTKSSRDNNNIYGAWWVKCAECSWRTSGSTEAAAITAWNTRATQPLSLTVDEGRLRDCLVVLLFEHDPSCGHLDRMHTAEKIAPLLLDRLQSLSLPDSSLQKTQTSAGGDIDRSGLAQEVE